MIKNIWREGKINISPHDMRGWCRLRSGHWGAVVYQSKIKSLINIWCVIKAKYPTLTQYDVSKHLTYSSPFFFLFLFFSTMQPSLESYQCCRTKNKCHKSERRSTLPPLSSSGRPVRHNCDSCWEGRAHLAPANSHSSQDACLKLFPSVFKW